MKRKFLLFALMFALVLMLVGCGNSGEVSDDTGDQASGQQSDSADEDMESEDTESEDEDYEYDDSVIKKTSVTGVHNISGDVLVYDDNTIVIENFTYDGKAPSTFVALGHHDDRGIFVYETVISEIIIDPYDGEDYFIEAPKGTNLADYEAVSIYCLQYRENFGSADFEEI